MMGSSFIERYHPFIRSHDLTRKREYSLYQEIMDFLFWISAGIGQYDHVIIHVCSLS